jgi:hypothetical protein
MRASWAISTTTDRPSATVTASCEPRSTPVNPYVGTFGAQGERQRVGEQCHVGGVRREEIHTWVGRSTRS